MCEHVVSSFLVITENIFFLTFLVTRCVTEILEKKIDSSKNLQISFSVLKNLSKKTSNFEQQISLKVKRSVPKNLKKVFQSIYKK